MPFLFIDLSFCVSLSPRFTLSRSTYKLDFFYFCLSAYKPDVKYKSEYPSLCMRYLICESIAVVTHNARTVRVNVFLHRTEYIK